MIEQFEHDAHRDRLQQVSSAPKVPNRLSERDRTLMEAWDREYDEQVWEGRSGVRGLIVGLLLMTCLAFSIYKIIAWYVSTMPPRSFIGLHKDAR